jgi:hypothetical protein
MWIFDDARRERAGSRNRNMVEGIGSGDSELYERGRALTECDGDRLGRWNVQAGVEYLEWNLPLQRYGGVGIYDGRSYNSRRRF